MDQLEFETNNWTQVEFTCMIQDILGNEIYEKQNGQFGDRTVFYCVSIPGENQWVRDANKNRFLAATTLFTPNPSSETTTTTTTDSNSRQQTETTANSLRLASYPIPSNENKSCLIKVYDINIVNRIRVNYIVHVKGVVEPTDFESDKQAGDTNGNNGINPSIDSEFEPTTDFSHQLVPRVHVKTLTELNHINPLLPAEISRNKLDLSVVKLARARLSTILTQLLGGDSLAADYLILSLISKIHRRKDVTTLGQLTVGLTGIKPEMRFLIDKLYQVIGKITTHSHFIDMSLANLNSLSFTPKKDHDNNKMIAGTLQLPDGIVLVLNETALSEGLLTAQGTENLNALNHIIRWQRHKYDFKYHSVEIDTDFKILVFGERKTILTVPYNVRIEKNDPESIDSMRQACEAVDDFLNDELLNMFRYYITALKEVPEYTIPDEVQKLIQNDFIAWRKDNELKGKAIFSADDLSSHMNLARYLTISRGETVLTNEIWKETCQMESARQSRMQQAN